MPAYRDEKRKTWTVRFKYKDWQGDTKSVTKRGFATKREGLDWEASFKLERAGSVDMSFAEFVDRYRKEREPRLKLSTFVTKGNIIDHQILPYFGKKKLADITTTDIIAWQNVLVKKINPRTGKCYSASYLKTVHAELSAIFNYAVKFFDLKSNPAAKVGTIGSEKEIKMNFWTKEEYMRFAEEMMDKPFAYYCFEVLYWTGMRVGEFLALTLDDVDLDKGTISITKTYHKINGKEIITSPKTAKSYRTITIPDFLVEEIREYIKMIYDLDPTDRLFMTDKSFLSRNLHKGAERAGLKKIRVHDLRHSHVSLLIDMGYSAVAVGDRVGHESVTITFRYAHMFPHVQKDMANKLNDLKEGEKNVTEE